MQKLTLNLYSQTKNKVADCADTTKKKTLKLYIRKKKDANFEYLSQAAKPHKQKPRAYWFGRRSLLLCTYIHSYAYDSRLGFQTGNGGKSSSSLRRYDDPSKILQMLRARKIIRFSNGKPPISATKQGSNFK